MRLQIRRPVVWIVSAVVAVSAAVVANQLASIAAGGLLYPGRRTSLPPRPGNCVEREFSGSGVRLRGWDCRTERPRRGTVIYLHGTADNRGSSLGVIRRFSSAGFDV